MLLDLRFIKWVVFYGCTYRSLIPCSFWNSLSSSRTFFILSNCTISSSSLAWNIGTISRPIYISSSLDRPIWRGILGVSQPERPLFILFNDLSRGLSKLPILENQSIFFESYARACALANNSLFLIAKGGYENPKVASFPAKRPSDVSRRPALCWRPELKF